jgi:hypothetical protein
LQAAITKLSAIYFQSDRSKSPLAKRDKGGLIFYQVLWFFAIKSPWPPFSKWDTHFANFHVTLQLERSEIPMSLVYLVE